MLSMRVIAGTYGGRHLKTLPGKTTRPTTDKVKGAMFNMIGPYFNGGRSLDLYAGSGNLSIEAVSRGIEEAVLVERDRKAQVIIQENIAVTKENHRFHLIKGTDKRALMQLEGTFDLVFLDPPYAKEEIVQTILTLEAHGLLSSESLVVCETDKNVKLPEEVGPLQLLKQKTYGISQVTIYGR